MRDMERTAEVNGPRGSKGGRGTESMRKRMAGSWPLKETDGKLRRRIRVWGRVGRYERLHLRVCDAIQDNASGMSGGWKVMTLYVRLGIVGLLAAVNIVTSRNGSVDPRKRATEKGSRPE